MQHTYIAAHSSPVLRSSTNQPPNLSVES